MPALVCGSDFLCVSLMSWIYTVVSLAAQRQMRSKWHLCSVKFSFSLAGSLQGPRAVQGWQPQSCSLLSPWAPHTCSENHLQECPIHCKLLLHPRLLCSAFSSRASKEQKGLEGEILWAIQQSQQGIEERFPKCPQLISVAVAKNLLEPRYSFEC